ncbi:MAG TPA: hypothetical protein VIV60_07855 [Polyangiaceae bacterium]
MALERRLRGSHAEANDFVVALSHTADNIHAPRAKAAVVFSRHHHSCQWHIPGIAASAIPSVDARRFYNVDFTVAGTELFVSARIGTDT